MKTKTSKHSNAEENKKVSKNKTENTTTLKDEKNTEILTGKSIEEVDKVKESGDNLQKKILEKLMK